MNARFLAFINGDWVKITLKPEQELSWGWSYRTEEGYSAGEYTWTHEGDKIRRAVETDSRDCDGRHGESYEDVCSIGELQSLPSYSGESVPNWKKSKERRIYDQYARMMGY